jgi:hypothetical protein
MILKGAINILDFIGTDGPGAQYGNKRSKSKQTIEICSLQCKGDMA